MSWTDERVDKLKELWGEGMSASQIAKVLGGVTRNAVIGKVHRLGLSNRGGGPGGGEDTPAAEPSKPKAAKAGGQGSESGTRRAKRRAGCTTPGPCADHTPHSACDPGRDPTAGARRADPRGRSRTCNAGGDREDCPQGFLAGTHRANVQVAHRRSDRRGFRLLRP